MYNAEYFQNMLGNQTNFIEIQGLVQSVRTAKNLFSLENVCNKLPNPICPSPIKLLLRDKKGCQRMYHILTNNTIIPVSQRKWQIELMPTPVLNWQSIYSSIYKCTKDTNIRWFQFKLLHRILSTNVFLNKIGIKDNLNCTFCNVCPESLSHLFYDCPLVQNFWHIIIEWLKGECTHIRSLELSKTDVICGIQEKQRTDDALDFILVHAKYFIYKNKYNNQVPNFQHFKHYILTCYNVEKCVAYSNCTWKTFNKTWMPYKNLLNHL